MRLTSTYFCLILVSLFTPSVRADSVPNRTKKPTQPNIIILFADDISARELPLYGSNVWSKPTGGDTTDVNFRAQTPVLDRLAREGCWIKTAWASVVCSPSRAMMMTGRYAHLHKWWGNKSKGTYPNPQTGKPSTWPLYESSPIQIGHIAQQAGYATYWSGKTQMAGDLREFGFDQGCFTPGSLSDKDNPYTDFKLTYKKIDGQRVPFNADSGKQVDTYLQHGWYWFPHVRLMNHSGKNFQWWPNNDDDRKTFGVNTYGPDVELDFIFDFMERKVKKDQPFLVYHTSHLGHDAFDWLNPDSTSKWPGTPVIQWDGEQYTRTTPNITGDGGVYDTHGTVTKSGIHHHINYLDYQVSLYLKKMKELGIADNTIFVFCSDNGTSGYGKNSTDRQKGTHVPLIIYGPGLTKQGQQDVLVNMADFLPTIAELVGTSLPYGYEINGKSLVPFLFSDTTTHRDWIYGYRDDQQIIRGKKVMRDGRGKWWNVNSTPEDLISFPMIKDWSKVSESHRLERDQLTSILPRFSQSAHGKNAPGAEQSNQGVKQQTNLGPHTILFEDRFEGNSLGKDYSTARCTSEAWRIQGGVLIGKQTNDDHGAVMRRELTFDDINVEFQFRFKGGSRFNFVIDDQHEKSVHAGHICRASLSPKRLTISDDKTGGMNLKVRQLRQSKTKTNEQKDWVDNLLKRTQSTTQLELKQERWYKLRITLLDDVMTVFLDDNQALQLQSAGFAYPTKTKLGMTVVGDSIEFDNFKAYQTGAAR